MIPKQFRLHFLLHVQTLFWLVSALGIIGALAMSLFSSKFWEIVQAGGSGFHQMWHLDCSCPALETTATSTRASLKGKWQTKVQLQNPSNLCPVHICIIQHWKHVSQTFFVASQNRIFYKKRVHALRVNDFTAVAHWESNAPLIPRSPLAITNRARPADKCSGRERRMQFGVEWIVKGRQSECPEDSISP